MKVDRINTSMSYLDYLDLFLSYFEPLITKRRLISMAHLLKTIITFKDLCPKLIQYYLN